MDTEINICPTNKWRARINQDGLYKEKGIYAKKEKKKDGKKPEPPSPTLGERLQG